MSRFPSTICRCTPSSAELVETDVVERVVAELEAERQEPPSELAARGSSPNGSRLT